MNELITISLVGETEARSAEEQLARDSQLKATNCRWDGSLILQRDLLQNHAEILSTKS